MLGSGEFFAVMIYVCSRYESFGTQIIKVNYAFVFLAIGFVFCYTYIVNLLFSGESPWENILLRAITKNVFLEFLI